MRKIARILSFFIILGWIGTSFAGTNDGLAFLRSKQGPDGTISGLGNTGWAVMALSGYGERNDRAIQSLQTVQTSLSTRSATDIEKQILALVAGGENPRTFAGVDAVVELQSRVMGNQIGDTDYLNDDIFGLLALRSAGASVPAEVSSQLLQHQNQDGGWGLIVGGASSTDLTAVALIALKGSVSQESLVRAMDYIRSLQNDDGGFAISSGGSSVASTAWVDWMLTEYGQSYAPWSKGGHSPRDFLLSTQGSDGSWGGSVLMTSYALIALSGRGFPIIGQFSTPTPTPSATTTPTPSPTLSVAPSPTPSPSHSPSTTPTVLPTATPSPSPTVTFSPLPTSVPSPSPSVSAIPTPSASSIVVPTASPTLNPSPGLLSTPAPTVLPVVAPTSTLMPVSTAPKVMRRTISLVQRIFPAKGTSAPVVTPTVSLVPVIFSPVPSDMSNGQFVPLNLHDYSRHFFFGGLLLAVNTLATGYEIWQAHKRTK
ncbi:MAG TPA: prenyltransferase/squalene oxidase repeat-containing protein [Patescibacteria group bacterium]